MCFHSKLTQKASSIEQRFNAKMRQAEHYQAMEAINGFSHPKTPVIIHKDQTHIDLFEWGLIPHWAKDDSIQNNTLNARMETLAEKASFKQILQQRCLVISEGFYEWQQIGPSIKQKRKYLIHKVDQGLFAFGGLYSLWQDPISGILRPSYTIVTTEAEGFMREIHNTKCRMPVILNQDHEALWLNQAPFDQFKHLPEGMAASAV